MPVPARSVQDTITSILQEALQPDYLSVDNESHMHSVPVNSETHFKLVVVSAALTDLRPVARHQRIYSLLQPLMQNPIHALALHTYSPAEWQAREQPAPASPDCLGGSKRENS